MKKTYDQSENDRPVINIIIIGLYIAAVIVLLSILFRRFVPVLETALDNMTLF